MFVIFEPHMSIAGLEDASRLVVLYSPMHATGSEYCIYSILVYIESGLRLPPLKHLYYKQHEALSQLHVLAVQ